jgi:glycerate kinase
MIAEVLRLDDRLRGADLVLTGEGRVDRQTARFGKGPAEVARRARSASVPVVAIGGAVVEEDRDELLRLFDRVVSLSGDRVSVEEATSDAARLLEDAAAGAVKSVAGQ